MRADITRLQRERAELADRVQSLQQGILRGSERLDQFRLAMNWNQEELDQWAAAERAKEEDNRAVEMYRCAAALGAAARWSQTAHGLCLLVLS